MRNLLQGPGVLMLLLASGSFHAALAQASGTPQGTAAIAAKLARIDIGGVRLGMPTKDAVAALKGMIGTPKILTTAVVPPFTEAAEAPPGNEQVTADATNAMGEKERIEFISTMPPNPQLVRWIRRKLTYPPGLGPSFDVTLADLRKEYGPESVVLASSLSERLNTMLIRWIYDANGKLLQGAAAQQEHNCTEGGTEGTAACPTLTIMEVTLQADGIKKVYAVNIEVESYPLNKSAREATLASKP